MNTPRFVSRLLFAALILLGLPAAAEFSGVYMQTSCVQSGCKGMDRANAIQSLGITIKDSARGGVSAEEQQLMACATNRINALVGDDHLTRGVTVVGYELSKGGKPFGTNTSSRTDGGNLISLVCRGNKWPAGTVMHYIHEMGHIAGQRSFYKSFQAGVPQCAPTGYGGTNRNEEFAEAYAMYVHSPNILREKCPKSFDWLAKNVFNKGQKPDDCSGNRDWAKSSEIVSNLGASGESPDDNGPGTTVESRGGTQFDLLTMLAQIFAAQATPASSATTPEVSRPFANPGTVTVPDGGNALPEVTRPYPGGN